MRTSVAIIFWGVCLVGVASIFVPLVDDFGGFGKPAVWNREAPDDQR